MLQEIKCGVLWPRAVSVKLIHTDMVLHMILCYYELNKLEWVEIPAHSFWSARLAKHVGVSRSPDGY